MTAALQCCSSRRYESGLVIEARYRLLRRLDEGGMSWVWLAHHVALDRPVAMKISKPLGAGTTELALREGRTTAALRHPAVVTVLDSGTTAWGDPFVVMEHLEGCSFADVLAREGRMNARVVVNLMLPVMDALSLCHERKILHGDIKPANIFLARENGRTRPKLLDFGIARSIAPCETARELSGTPGYIAPEQIMHAAVDQRADVWSMCAVLYEAAAGHPAIAGRTCTELLDETRAPKIEPLQGSSEASTLWPILEHGLRVAPDERLPTMRALADALAAWLATHGTRSSGTSLEDVVYGNADRQSGVELRAELLPRRATPAERSDLALCDTIAAGEPPARRRRDVQWHWRPLASAARGNASIAGASFE